MISVSCPNCLINIEKQHFNVKTSIGRCSECNIVFDIKNSSYNPYNEIVSTYKVFKDKLSNKKKEHTKKDSKDIKPTIKKNEKVIRFENVMSIKEKTGAANLILMFLFVSGISFWLLKTPTAVAFIFVLFYYKTIILLNKTVSYEFRKSKFHLHIITEIFFLKLERKILLVDIIDFKVKDNAVFDDDDEYFFIDIVKENFKTEALIMKGFSYYNTQKLISSLKKLCNIKESDVKEAS